MIAHRLSTIRQADNIVVLQNGSIVAQGSQEELLDSCPLYLVVALAGNITGGLLTWTKGGGQVFEDGYELKKEENAYV